VRDVHAKQDPAQSMFQTCCSHCLGRQSLCWMQALTYFHVFARTNECLLLPANPCVFKKPDFEWYDCSLIIWCVPLRGRRSGMEGIGKLWPFSQMSMILMIIRRNGFFARLRSVSPTASQQEKVWRASQVQCISANVSTTFLPYASKIHRSILSTPWVTGLN
jgi:hypothetical protein